MEKTKQPVMFQTLDVATRPDGYVAPRPWLIAVLAICWVVTAVVGFLGISNETFVHDHRWLIWVQLGFYVALPVVGFINMRDRKKRIARVS